MKIVKIALLSIVGIVVIFAISFGVYLFVNMQKPAEPFEVIYGSGEARVLVATQGSKFKDALSTEILRLLEGENLYIKGVDISELSNVDPVRWDALVIIHTTEKWELPKEVQAFLTHVEIDKVIHVVTSGSGEWAPESTGIDAITSASKDGEIMPIAIEIVSRVKEIIHACDDEQIQTSPPGENDET